MRRWAFVFVLAATAHAATWYVRPDGGTRYSAAKTQGQCDGLTDAAYPGSGVNQHCAYNDIRWLWADGAYATAAGPHWAWVGQGGDTYILDCPNSCRIGYDNGQNSNGYMNAQGWAVALAGNPYSSGAPPPPSGTADHPTRIMGKNWQSCAEASQRTMIHGGYGVNPVLGLQGVSYVDVACLDISDHSSCTRNATSQQCKTGYPMDDYSTSGIQTSNTTTHVSITDVRVHGMAGNGMVGPTGDGVSLERVSLEGNASSGWNMDLGNGTTGTGTLTLDHFRVLWSGCSEEYPPAHQLPYVLCTDQSSGGYGDGIGTATVTSNPAWHMVITNSEAAFNTQDGFDLLHLEGGGSTLTITSSLMHSNMGQQLKVGGSGIARNNLIVGNCNSMRQAIPGTPQGYNANLTNFCRAADTMVVIGVLDGSVTDYEFNTMFTAGATGIQIVCGAGSGKCGTASSLLYQDNIFVGFKNSVENGYPSSPPPTNDYSNPIYLEVNGLFSNPGTKYTNNATWHWKSNWACPQAKYNEAAAVCADPQLADMTWHIYGYGDMTPLTGSPVLGAGIAIAGVTVDHAGVARPTPPSIGAYELPGTPPPNPNPCTCTEQRSLMRHWGWSLILVILLSNALMFFYFFRRDRK